MTHRFGRLAASLALLFWALFSWIAFSPPHAFAQDRPAANEVTLDQGPAATIPAPPATALAAWGIADSDIRLDPAIRLGVLPNGMRYAIRHNETPAGTVIVRMRFATGSLAETEDQRGLAHFVEHMAFNGSTHVPEGEMVKLLEREGLAFGADTNASTGFDETIYKLDLPRSDPALLGTAMMLMREIASEMSFDPQAVERERGVVLAELRDGETYQRRNLESGARFFLPGTLYPDRFPIGLAEVLRTAPPETLRAYYDRWYTPARTTLVIVGDIDPQAVEAMILARFADWQARQGETLDPFTGLIDVERPADANVFVHPAIGEAVQLEAYAPWREERDTTVQRERNTLRSIGHAIINRRLQRLTRREDAPFTGASIATGNLDELARSTRLHVSSEDGEWATALSAAEQEVRRALIHGFTMAEVAEQRARMKTSLENAVSGQATRSNSAHAAALLAAATEPFVIASPEDGLDRFNDYADRITPDRVLAVLKEDMVPLDRPLIHMTTKTPLEGGGGSLLAALAGSRAIAVAPSGEREEQRFAYEDFGLPGSVVEDSRIDDLGVRTIRFANNVRLNIKQTPFEDDRVRVSVRVDGGALLATPANPYATALMGIFDNGGLAAHSQDELQTLLAGRSVSTRFEAGIDYFGGYVTTTPRDLELQLQIYAAYLVAPGYRHEALAQYHRSLPNYYARLDATPGSALGSQIGGILSNGDPRFSLAPRETVEALTLEQLRSGIADRLANGAIEIGIVGDVDEAQAIAMVARNFGALPLREPEFLPHAEGRMRVFTPNGACMVGHDGEPGQAIVQFYWPTRDQSEPLEDIGLTLLAQIVQLRLTDELRERLGSSYSPDASSATSAVFPGYGYLSISTAIDGDTLPEVEGAIHGIVAELATTPIDADLLDRARRPIIERLTIARQQNARWINIVDEAQSRPDQLQRFRDAEKLYDAVTPADLRMLAQRYLDGDALEVVTAHRDRLADLETRPDYAEHGSAAVPGS